MQRVGEHNVPWAWETTERIRIKPVICHRIDWGNEEVIKRVSKHFWAFQLDIFKLQRILGRMYTASVWFKGIFHQKIKICRKYTQPQAIQFEFFLHLNRTLSSAVNGCRLSVVNSWLKQQSTNYPHDFSPPTEILWSEKLHICNKFIIKTCFTLKAHNP